MDSLSTTERSSEAAAHPGTAAGDPMTPRLRIAMAAAWTLVILVLCWMPATLIQEVEKGSSWFDIPDLDKVVHWGIFVLFTVLWLRAGRSRRRYAWVALGGLALAAITELVQNLPIVGRDGEINDAITDVIGVAIGLAVARWIEPVLAWLESRLIGPLRP